MKVKAEGDGAAAFDELLQHYESRIGALRRARESLEAAKPAITPPASPGSAGEEEPRCRALLALALFQEMVDDMAMGVVFETHCEAKQDAAVCPLCGTRCQGGGRDLQPQPAQQAAGAEAAGAEAFECPSCQRSFPAARFAAHMDKCMGLSSRRAATRSRSAAGSSSAAPTPMLAGAAGSCDSSSEHSATADRRRRAQPAAKRARR
ncbi:hypothetical protein H4R18_001089 [Coemansia javaensis]|uniref:SAGA-associated factor 11 n=1 Tax=Coemansia javaensis TaxID=2761396 RepID=A0A9W8LJN3_9FUNG|nr:hypothetical protein H4R18_001089 [Coemansia javaensis]